jgi:hypothetical protein
MTPERVEAALLTDEQDRQAQVKIKEFMNSPDKLPAAIDLVHKASFCLGLKMFGLMVIDMLKAGSTPPTDLEEAVTVALRQKQELLQILNKVN